MANIILHNADRERTTERIMKQYGVDRKDPSMREAAEIAAARTHEAIEEASRERRYY